MSRWAVFNEDSGRAVVYEESGTDYTLEVRHNLTIDGPHKVERGFNTDMWVQPAACRSPAIDIGEFPFPTLQHFIRHKVGVKSLVQRFVCALEREPGERFRRRAAKLFETMHQLATPEMIQEFRLIMLNKPMPSVLDPTLSAFRPDSYGAKLLAEMLKKWRPTQT